MTITREQVVIEAREWLGTPYLHQGRIKGMGVDCVGLTIGIAKNVGILDEMGIPDLDVDGYNRSPDPIKMKSYLDKYMNPITKSDVLPGDWFWIKFQTNTPQHMAMFTDEGTVIHAYANVGRCTEHRYADVWVARTYGAFRYKVFD